MSVTGLGVILQTDLNCNSRFRSNKLHMPKMYYQKGTSLNINDANVLASLDHNGSHIGENVLPVCAEAGRNAALEQVHWQAADEGLGATRVARHEERAKQLGGVPLDDFLEHLLDGCVLWQRFPALP